MINMRFETKQDFEACLNQLCKCVKPYFSEDKCRVNIGLTKALYDDSTIGMEGFSRLLWGLVPLWAGQESDLLYEEILEGIRAGANLQHPSGWGKLCDEHQSFVEMAPIALGLLLTPEKIWEPLSETEKENLNRWLLQINEYKLPRNNWYFFRVLVNAGFMRIGGEYDSSQMESDLDVIESFYLGDGWYSDGKTKQRDYYISFAIHFYSLIYVKFMREKDGDRCQRMIERSKRFAEDFIYWFAKDGGAISYGRSLTYRFAQCGFWCALAFAEVEAYSWGVVKGIVCRHFRYWFSKPITDERGILTIGYGYPNLNMAEGYNAPGSPYWALKSFLILALEDAHPFWTAKEEPLPKLDRIKSMKHPMMLLTRTDKEHVVVLTSGQYPGFEPVHSAEKYSKFAYSNQYSFHVPRSYHRLEQAVPDNMLAFYRDGLYFVRRECKEVIVEENYIKSIWSPFKGVEVETILEPYENGHKRTHTITLEVDCEAVECGFGIPVDDYQRLLKQVEGKKACIAAETDFSRVELLEGEGIAKEFLAEANSNLLYPRTVVPYLSFFFEKGRHTISVYVEAGELEN